MSDAGTWMRCVICPACKRSWDAANWSWNWFRPYCKHCGSRELTVALVMIVERPKPGRRWWAPWTWGTVNRFEFESRKDEEPLEKYTAARASGRMA